VKWDWRRGCEIAPQPNSLLHYFEAMRIIDSSDHMLYDMSVSTYLYQTCRDEMNSHSAEV
jgi:hypothetical protein